MFFTETAIPSTAAIYYSLLSLSLLAIAITYAPWKAIWQVPLRQHLILGSSLSLLALWALHIRFSADFAFHPMGITTITLMLGWPLAIIVGCLTQLLATIIGLAEWPMIGPDILCSVIAPASATIVALKLIRSTNIRNPFAYMLGAGFSGGMFSVIVTAATAITMLIITGENGWKYGATAPTWEPEWEQLSLLALLMFPEGFINGMMITLLTVFHPSWLKTFDEEHFLEGEKR